MKRREYRSLPSQRGSRGPALPSRTGDIAIGPRTCYPSNVPDKIKDLDDLRSIVHQVKREGKKVVFTNGCFDILHRGHLHLLREAKKLGDLLIVAMNSDGSIREIKGPSRPILPEEERAELLASLEMVDFVTIFPQPDPSHVIQELGPNVLVKGGDWAQDKIIGREFVEQHGGRAVVVPMLSDYSTTKIIERIRQDKPWQGFAPSAAKGNQ